LSYAYGGHGRRDVGHGVVDCEARGYGSPRRVYVEGYGLLWGVGFEVEELGYDGCGDGFVYFAVEADYSFLFLSSAGAIKARGVEEQGNVLGAVLRICQLEKEFGLVKANLGNIVVHTCAPATSLSSQYVSSFCDCLGNSLSSL
jgi:hypothetical protein